MVRKVMAWAVVALTASAVLTGCSDGGDAPVATPSVENPPSADVTASMVDNAFVPEELIVPVGVPVTITASNDGAAVHNMLVTVGETQAHTDFMVAPRTSSTFEVTFPHAGDYDFVCGLHLPDMAGTITAR